jgi:hypothetical protein
MKKELHQIAREAGWECSTALFPPLSWFKSDVVEAPALAMKNTLSRRGSDFDALGGECVLYGRNKKGGEGSVLQSGGLFLTGRKVAVKMSQEVRVPSFLPSFKVFWYMCLVCSCSSGIQLNVVFL